MKRLFEIDENEKRRILEMHENATKNLYLMEQATSKFCFADSMSDGLVKAFSGGNPKEICEKLKTMREFYNGKYYFKPTGENEVGIYTPNGAIYPTLMGFLTYKLDGKGGIKWGYDTAMTKITSPDKATLTYMKTMNLTPQQVLTYIRDFASEKNLDGNLFNEFMSNFLNSNPDAKQGFTNILNEFNRLYQGREDYEKIKKDILDNPNIASLPRTQS